MNHELLSPFLALTSIHSEILAIVFLTYTMDLKLFTYWRNIIYPDSCIPFKNSIHGAAAAFRLKYS